VGAQTLPKLGPPRNHCLVYALDLLNSLDRLIYFRVTCSLITLIPLPLLSRLALL
jgi:hypothetical protein